MESELWTSDSNIVQSFNSEKRELFISHIFEAFRQGSEGIYSDTMLLSKPWGIDFTSMTVPIVLWYGESDTLPRRKPTKMHGLPGNRETSRRLTRVRRGI
ncbi:MAG: hypothetical protein COA73_05735 [Candidatus Hydrogenedentota bacterium]|nr:MAG: hypothetical protein COA73_05735 [Candidatus Hydrogenedentota bacterium]